MTNKDKALKRMWKYCAYRERCHQEVRNKLNDLGVYGDDAEEIMAELISENYLNEERFAREFTWGKFNNNSWGRRKIIQALKAKEVSEYCIEKGLSELSDDIYQDGLKNLLTRKLNSLQENDPNKIRPILFNFAHNKGFENFLVVRSLNDLIGPHNPDDY